MKINLQNAALKTINKSKKKKIGVVQKQFTDTYSKLLYLILSLWGHNQIFSA